MRVESVAAKVGSDDVFDAGFESGAYNQPLMNGGCRIEGLNENILVSESIGKGLGVSVVGCLFGNTGWENSRAAGTGNAGDVEVSVEQGGYENLPQRSGSLIFLSTKYLRYQVRKLTPRIATFLRGDMTTLVDMW
jgi:hypothetical protein